MLGGATSPGGEDLLTVTVVRDEYGYGMKVSGDNPVYVQSVKEHGAAWRAGLRAGDRILRVDSVPVHHHTHQQVVHMIRANPTTVLTVQQNTSRHKTPITAPVPVNSEKQRQLEVSKVHTMRLMLDQEQKYIRDLRNEVTKVPDVRKQTQLEAAEQRCSVLQHQIDNIMVGQPTDLSSSSQPAPSTPRPSSRNKTNLDKSFPPAQHTGFLSGLPRSLSNLTGQSLRNLRHNRQNSKSQENQPPLVRQNSDETDNKRRHVHNNTVPMVPTTCLDNVTPPPLPPRSIERPKRIPSNLAPSPINPLAKTKPSNSTPTHKQYYKGRYYPEKNQFSMHQSMPSYSEDNTKQFRRSSHSLDGELEGPQPNSIALQMSYPLVNAPPPPLQTDNRSSVPVLHVRSRSSPEQLDCELSTGWIGARSSEVPSPLHGGLVCATPTAPPPSGSVCGDTARDTPPPGTPPPPYHTNTQPCADPQRTIISMEEDDSPASDTSTYSGLFSNLRSVRESKARTAVLLNWLLGERRCACASLLLILTDGYRGAAGVPLSTLRRWAYEIHSTFLMPGAVLQLNGVDENMANEIEHVLVNEHEKEELLRNVFRKARQKAKEELAHQLAEFQVKRQVGLGSLYGPDDAIIHNCGVDKAQEQVVVEQVMMQQLRGSAATVAAAAAAGGSVGVGGDVISDGGGGGRGSRDARNTLFAALIAAALVLHCSEIDAREVRRRWWETPKSLKKRRAKLTKPASVAAAVGGNRPSFLQRDKLYKQRVKQITKQYPQPFIQRGHHLQLQALTSIGHCHRCDNVITGLAPQACVCADCKLRVHRDCVKYIEEGCCLDNEHHNNRIIKFMERIHNANNQPNNQDSNDKKSRKSSGAAHFLNMERSFRKTEDEPPWDATLTPVPVSERRVESDESLYESADGHSDAISASDDALSRLKTPAISKESLKLAVTDEEVEIRKKGHRKTLSLSNPLEIVRSLGDEWFDATRHDRNFDKKKSRESLWSEEDRESIHGSSVKLDQIRKDSKKDKNSQSNSRKSSTTDPPKPRKSSKRSSVGALGFLRRKKTSTTTAPIEAVAEDAVKTLTIEEILNYTKLFLDFEKRHSSECESRPPAESDSDDEPPTPKQIAEHRRRLSRQTSRSKSKVRGKSQSLKVNTLRKTHSGTLKKGKKKSVKATSGGRSRQASIVEQTPVLLKKNSDNLKQNSWLFSGSKGESRREGSTDDQTPAPDADIDTSDANTKEPDRDTNWRSAAVGIGGRGVNRAESCRERDVPRRGKHRNASDPNRLTAHNHHDLEPGAPTAPSGSSSSSSLSSRSNESTTVTAEQQASQSDWSEEEDPLAAQWTETIPPHVLDSLVLCARLRKRQEVIHELIVSEGSHVRWLKVLGGLFLRPLEKHPTLLPAEELRALFPNLPGVKERHSKLYADLRALRADNKAPIVQIRPLADAMLNTLGDGGYASCLSKFCRGQRMALEALRERRRKNKELHQFLANKEQQPLCGRLQLRDLLACVWQRLTKYQLLLEGVVKTVCESDNESEHDVARIQRALTVAKDVLHRVDTAIRTAENEHRLRTIQSKLEIRIPSGVDWEELKRFDLTQHQLKMEGDLSIRNDSKKINVLALMLEDSLVLVQREGDKFVLKPISQSSSTQHQQLSPLIKWDKVLFRANAAVRNAFFLMNINGVQMHELSANTPAEYATWVKYIQDSPLAKLTELKSSVTPSHQHSKSADDSGINVSRNPSDASEKSTSTAPTEEPEMERDRASLERTYNERERDDMTDNEHVDDKKSEERDERRSIDKDELTETDDQPKGRRRTVGRISTHEAEPSPVLEPSAALHVHEPAAQHTSTAVRAYTHAERLRRIDEVIRNALSAKSGIVAEILGVPEHCYEQLADLAVADALGQVDVGGELRSIRGHLTRSDSVEELDPPHTASGVTSAPTPDLHHLLLAAQTQANQLTRSISLALSVSETAAVSARARGRCDQCRNRNETTTTTPTLPVSTATDNNDNTDVPEVMSTNRPDASRRRTAAQMLAEYSLARHMSYDLLPDLDTHSEADECTEDNTDWSVSGTQLAARMAGPVCGLQRTLSLLLNATQCIRDEATLRAEMATLRDHNDALRARLQHDNQATEEITLPKEIVDTSTQDQPTNGG